MFLTFLLAATTLNAWNMKIQGGVLGDQLLRLFVLLESVLRIRLNPRLLQQLVDLRVLVVASV